MVTRILYDRIVSDFIDVLNEAKNWIVSIAGSKTFMPSGHNGPHYNLETPVRNTAHWSVAYLVASKYNLLSDAESIAKKFCNWLIDDNPHYQKGWYIIRQSGNSDWCNGVIGNAWVIEALARFSRISGDKKAESRSKEILHTNKFNSSKGAWHRFDSITKRNSIDFTFDHQAWFAAAVCDLQITDDTITFLDRCLQGAFRVRDNGLIHHLFFAVSFKNFINRLFYRYNDIRNPGRSQIVEEGYQIYTLFPLARIKHYISNHPFFDSKKFQMALDYCTKENLMKMRANRYGFQYNAPGLELPMVALVFGDRMPLSTQDVEQIYQAQIRHSCPEGSALFTQNNPDPLTLSARIYELALFIEAYNSITESR